VLTDRARVEEPVVVLRAEDGTRIQLADSVFDPTADTLTVTVPPLAPGTYDVVVENPNGFSGMLAAGLAIVPPPTVTAIDPNTGQPFTAIPVDILGTDFRAAGDGTEPHAVFTPSAGGDEIELAEVAWVEPGLIDAIVPAGLAEGTYDLTVTNPEGCSATLVAAFTVVIPPPIDLCDHVDPAFGWINGRTRIELCADNSGGRGLLPVPEVFLILDDHTEVPLIREAFLFAHVAAGGFADASLMSAVVPSSQEPRGAGLVVGGPYDLRVENPDGAMSILRDAFTLVADPPPVISSISPEQGETGGTANLEVRGSGFKDPATGNARILFLAADQAVGATCAAPSCFFCGTPAWHSVQAVSCAPPLAAMAAGSYLVRYEHLDDGSFGELAAFSVTNPSGNLESDTAPMPPLFTQRWAHGAVVARDSLGNRFLYVVGGRSNLTATSALDSVEVAAITRFGELAAWQTLPVHLPRALSGMGLCRQGDYLFAVGGADDTDGVRAEVLRARVLGDDTAPVILAPTAESAGSLGAGTYSYRVSAVMGMGSDNEGGESLASDAESIRLNDDGAVRVRWEAVSGATSYRVFRTATANEVADGEVFLAAVTGTDYLDDGSATPGTDVPQPPGALGQWLVAGTLTLPRTDAMVTVAHDPADVPFLYVLGGVTSGSTDPLDSYEVAMLSEGNGAWQVSTFGRVDAGLDDVRAQAVVATLDEVDAPLLSGLGTELVVLAQGLTLVGVDLAVFYDVSLAEVQAGGLLGSWSVADSTPSADRYGAAGFLANNFLFSIGGRRAAGGYEDKGRTAEVCPSRSDCVQHPPVITWANGDSGITLSTARYRPGGVYANGFFYLTGGRVDATTITPTVERGSYAN
jgi:hypothetical protein